MGLVMRIFSLVFHTFIGVAMVAVSCVAWASNQHTLQLGFLPWQGQTLTMVLFFSGLAALIFTFLGFKRRLGFLFILWNLAVVVLLIRGFFFSSFTFTGSAFSFWSAVYLTGAALLALMGSLCRRQAAAAARKHAVAV